MTEIERFERVGSGRSQLLRAVPAPGGDLYGAVLIVDGARRIQPLPGPGPAVGFPATIGATFALELPDGTRIDLSAPTVRSASLDVRVRELDALLGRERAESRALREQMAALENELEELRALETLLQSELASAREERAPEGFAAAPGDDLGSLRAELETTRAEAEALGAELDAARSAGSGTRADDALRNDLETAQMELTLLGAELETLRGEARDREAALAALSDLRGVVAEHALRASAAERRMRDLLARMERRVPPADLRATVVAGLERAAELERRAVTLRDGYAAAP